MTVIALPCLTIFPVRIWLKEMSFRKKHGWTEVEKRSNIIVPRILGVGDFPLVVLWVVLLVYQAL
jgi:hypothetical protein